MSATVPAAAGSSTNTIAPQQPSGSSITPTTGVTSASPTATGATSVAASPSSILSNIGTSSTNTSFACADGSTANTVTGLCANGQQPLSTIDPTVDQGTAMLIPDDLEILPWSISMYTTVANASPNSRWYGGLTSDECGPGDEDCMHVVPFSPAYLASMRHYNENGDFEVEPMTAYYAPSMPTGTQIEDLIKKYWWVLALGLGLVVVAKL